MFSDLKRIVVEKKLPRIRAIFETKDQSFYKYDIEKLENLYNQSIAPDCSNMFNKNVEY